MEAWFIIGGLAATILLVVTAHSTALRRYAKLLDVLDDPRGDEFSGQVQGRFDDRPTAISLSLPERRTKRPGELRVSVECSAPLTFRVERKSLATGVQQATGLRHDRASGDEVLDRGLLFQFDDRAQFTKCLERPEIRSALLTLAELGVGPIWLEHGRFTASHSLGLVLPPRVGLVRMILLQLAVTASAMESVLAGGSQAHHDALASEAPNDRLQVQAEAARGPRARTQRLAFWGPLMIVAFFVASALAYSIVAPIWDPNTLALPELVALMWTRTVVAALAAAGMGFVAALLAGGKPILWGVGVSWPLFFYVAAVWVYCFILGVAGAHIFEPVRAGTDAAGTQGLAVLTAAPLLLLLSGWAGARLGNSCRIAGASSVAA